MSVTRARFGSAFEVMVAAGFLVATFVVGSLIVRELRTVHPALPAPTAEKEPARVPSRVPPQAISVPALLLLDGKEIHVGDAADQVAALLGPGAEVGAKTVEHGPIGDRVTRAYEHTGTRFILVFEPFEAKGHLRVAGIFIH